MMETYERFRSRGLEAIFVAMPYDRPDRVLAYARSKALPFKVVLDVKGEINLGFGHVRATPTTFIVDKRGRIVERILGAPDFARLHRFIAARLDEAGGVAPQSSSSTGSECSVGQALPERGKATVRSRLASLTNRVVRARPGAGSAHSVSFARSWCGEGLRGNDTRKVVNWSGSLRAATVAPCASASCLAM